MQFFYYWCTDLYSGWHPTLTSCSFYWDLTENPERAFWPTQSFKLGTSLTLLGRPSAYFGFSSLCSLLLNLNFLFPGIIQTFWSDYGMLFLPYVYDVFSWRHFCVFSLPSWIGCSLVYLTLGFPVGSDSKESASNAGDSGSVPRLVRFPGEGNGNPL